MSPTYTLSVPDPQPGIAPGDRWCALSGPHAPLPAILASADEWLLIAGAIEAGDRADSNSERLAGRLVVLVPGGRDVPLHRRRTA